MSLEQLTQQINSFIQTVDRLEIENKAAIKSRETLENSIRVLAEKQERNKEALDIATHAIEILKEVSDEAVSKAYGFLVQNLNVSLARMFKNTTRRIEIKEYLRNNQYPQLELILHVGNGRTRSLKTDSGHGLAQIVSLLSILSLIVITGSRRILVMDEIISGVSVHNRKVIEDILWTFTEIGFQFIINEHGYIPKNSVVFHLEMVGDVSTVKKTYVAKKGVYLQGNGRDDYDYDEQTTSDNITDDIEIEEDIFELERETREKDSKDNNSAESSNIISI